jgi:large subunit ribosomal protein L14
MKGIAGNQTRGLQNGSRLDVIDNTGAKVIEIIEAVHAQNPLPVKY